MTADSPESPAPLQHPGIAGEPADDDALIEKLRTRAWDPGRRFDTARVPSSWIAERYGADWFDRPNPDPRSTGSDGTVRLRSSTAEVASYYADAPRKLLFPPVTMAEVADSGFGPGGGLVSLREANRAPRHLSDWPSAMSVRERDRTAGVLTSWFFLTGGGCTMSWYVSLLADDNPVLLYDCDGWVPDWGETPHGGLSYATSSLRKWLWTWAEAAISGARFWTNDRPPPFQWSAEIRDSAAPDRDRSKE
ncbi:hypothetical protein ACFWXO_38445 [Kitasatospora sp. NPDC059088]|uniref:hypothetical protein n=1 Tax=Kitasatospora sp. NPDC059088 TaxID=3346722 RepID=UPI003699E47F